LQAAVTVVFCEPISVLTQPKTN